MKKITLLSILISLAFLLVGCSATVETTRENRKTINVTSTGFASTTPNIVDIQLGVETIHSDPAMAVNQNSAIMKDVMDALLSLEIVSDDIETVFYSMWVEDIYDENGQLTGERRYRITNQINVRVGDLDLTGVLLEKAIDAGATTIAGITFGVDDTTELAQKALDNAIVDARKKAERIASEMGMSLGSVITISEGNPNATPMPFNDIKGLRGVRDVPISEGQFSMTMTVRITYEIVPLSELILGQNQNDDE